LHSSSSQFGGHRTGARVSRKIFCTKEKYRTETKRRFFVKKFVLAIMALAVAAAVTRPATAQTFTVLHEFHNFDGSLPEAALIQDANGTLYGTTFAGGDDFEGTVFKLGKLGRETVLLSFGLSNGAFPASNLVFDKAGNLYGTAAEGPGGAGVLFRVARDGSSSEVVHSFLGGQDSVAAVPAGGVIIDGAGNFYGAAQLGGVGFGSLYEVNPAGDLRVLHTFDGKEGAEPLGPLVRDADGNLYGVTLLGGNHNKGTVFKLGNDGTLTALHSFGGKDGISPMGGLFRDSAGNLYGSAALGGDSGKGTLFQITKAGIFRRLYSFTGGTDGATPNGGLVRDAAGNLYGTAQFCGADGQGTVVQLSPAHVLTVLHTFTGNRDGAFPNAGLFRDKAGNLYGTAVKNLLPPLADGAVFKITP
jgi:uncharacterized repeat protein (TIGR03803 family)